MKPRLRHLAAFSLTWLQAFADSPVLTASDGAAYDYFGGSVALSGTIALAGVLGDTIGSNPYQGSAYVFRNLDTGAGTVTQNVKLTASDGAAYDALGHSVALSDTTAIIGAGAKKPGTAYVFRNLTAASGTVVQNVKLLTSNGGGGDYFGKSVGISGTTGVVGAAFSKVGENVEQGAAYVFRNLDSASGTITQNAKLLASDGTYSDFFGISLAVSGNTVIAGAAMDDSGTQTDQGSAYVFRNINSASATVTQDVKLTASDGAVNDSFGTSVALDDDRFVIGSSGKAYTGTINAVTTLNVGGSKRMIDGISFVSQEDWVIGKTTDHNVVKLTSGDSAIVTTSGKFVAIGQDTGADGNALQIDGTVTATQIMIGASGSKENILKLGSGGTIHGATLYLARENFLSLQGDFTSPGSLLTRLGTSTLQVWDGDSWEVVTNANQASLLSRFSSGGVTTFAPLLPLPNSAWRVVQFGSDAADPVVSGWTADPDQDGISNLLERAFNLPPRQPGVATLPPTTGTSGMPLVSLTPGDVPLLSIEYVRLKAAANTGLIYIPQFSSIPDSGFWSAADRVETVESIDETWERVKVTDTIPSSPDRRFGRVRVELP